MANPVKFEIKGGEQFAQLGAAFEPTVKQELYAALNITLKEGKKHVQASIREANAVAFGNLLRSVTDKINSLSSFDWEAVGEITFLPPADEYASEADKGRGPSKGGGGSNEFFNRILAWVSIKGIDRGLAYPIARSINTHGTNVSGWSKYGRTSFMETATKRVDEEAQKQFDRIASRIQRRLDTNAVNNPSSP